MPSDIGWPERSGADDFGGRALPPRRNPASNAVRAVAQLPGAALSALIVALFAPLAALTNAKVERFLLAIAILNMPLTFGVTLGYREDVADFGALGGWYLSPTTLALAGLYAGLLLKLPPGGAGA